MDIRSSAPKIESWDVGMRFASDSRPGSELNSRRFHQELDTGHGQGLVGCWTSLHNARFLLDVGSHAMSASCQVLDISRVVSYSCWVVGVSHEGRFLLDVGFHTMSPALVRSWIPRVWYQVVGRLMRRDIFVGCWTPHVMVGSCRILGASHNILRGVRFLLDVGCLTRRQFLLGVSLT